jgi:hypothetical protein
VKCPYCEESINYGATVCKTCRRDIGLALSLGEAKQVLEQRVLELEAELAELRGRDEAEPEAAAVESTARPPAVLDLLMIYFVVPTIVLVGTHYLLIIKFDARLVWLRAASIALPAVFGLMLERKLQPRWYLTLALGIVVGLASVFGMSTMVHFSDGDSILPDSAVAWRETLEYVTSIALAYLLGSLIAFAAHPLRSTGPRRTGRMGKLATLVAHHSGLAKGLPLEVRAQRAMTLFKIVATVSTAAGSVYTGFKSIL